MPRIDNKMRYLCFFGEKQQELSLLWSLWRHEYKKTAGPMLWSAAVSELRSQIDELHYDSISARQSLRDYPAISTDAPRLKKVNLNRLTRPIPSE